VLEFAFSKPGTPNIKTLAFGMSRVLAWVILKALALLMSKAPPQLIICVPLERLAEEFNKQ